MTLPLDKASFRHAMGHFASGVTVMTTTTAGRMHGMTVSAFASQSLDPLLILVSVERSTEMHKLVMASRAFAINVLGEHAEGTARFFADNARLKGPEFIEGAYRIGLSGAPLLNEAVAVLEATVDSTLEAGDHSIIVGRVTALEVRSDAQPLVYYRSGYRRLD
ncbi:MAG TPA: flavin reductase family protein [Candidatus Dormibacteraeota bacterium]|nr:flavin reductase family protein [Candidatus Dormibacteraeota bacterium]